MISEVISRLIILVFGTLYPAYCSYTAIRTKNVKEYVRWMMHWVVFSCFVTIETFSDVFLSWFPFYYEVKVCIVFWLLSPMTKGSSILYKKFIHPKLSRHEQDIDEYINQAKEKGYKAVIDAGTKTFDYASKLIVETAIKVVTLPLNSAHGSFERIEVIERQTSRDVVDYGLDDALPQYITPPTSPLNNGKADQDEQMHEFEFSDPEPDTEPKHVRTRSQSRMKEGSMPPVEPAPKKKKVRRDAIRVKEEMLPRRRRAIQATPIEINTDDDE